jgi:CRISPR-associated protein Csx10
MIELELTLKTEAPLVLRASRTSAQFTPTLTHIPGTTLRGALALDYLRRGGKPEEAEFQTLFLSGTVSFGPLFPSTEAVAGQPLPASAVACKRYGAKHAASVGDVLLRLELADILNSLASLSEWELCPDCRAGYPDYPPNKRDRLEGYYLQGETFNKVKPDVRMLTGVGMSRSTGTAAHGLLFSMKALEEAQHFKGHIRLDSDEAETLTSRLQELAPREGILRLGAARSRGQGRVRVADWQLVKMRKPSLAERWQALNTVIRRLWAQYEVEPEGDYFTLTLESPLILRAPYLRPRWPDELNTTAFGLPAGVERRRTLLSEVTLQGWNAAWRLPKRDTPALGMGSVFLFHAPATLRADILTRLEEIEVRGLGERRNEGFGRVRVCDPFHYRFEEVEV